MKFSKFAKVAVSFASLVAASAMLPSDASEGLFDMFKGRPTANANSSGRQLIAFQTKAEPGTIIVSFTDRKLYYVLTNSRAISYPIAGPKDGAEWAGEMTVTEKRINPDWTPTAVSSMAWCMPLAQVTARWSRAPIVIRHGAISARPGTYCSLVSRLENSVSICRAGLHSVSKAS